jgi:hypothetical protein
MSNCSSLSHFPSGSGTHLKRKSPGNLFLSIIFLMLKKNYSFAKTELDLVYLMRTE